MTIEIIIHYDSTNKEKDLRKTLKSIKKTESIPDEIRLCINQPAKKDYRYSDFQKLVELTLNTKIKSHLQILTNYSTITGVINHTAELSKADHYIFVNAGYAFKDNEIVNAIKNNAVIFSDGVDDKLNEFSCKVKVHKQLFGFGFTQSLPDKIEHKLKMLKDAKNAATATELAEGGSDNL